MDAVTKFGPESIATAGESSRVGFGELQEHAPGTARVRSVAVRAHEIWLTLDCPGGREIVVALPGVAPGDQTTESHGLTRPLAVLIRNRHTQVDCSVLGTSEQGPKRVAITVEQALALCGDGVHTVLRSES